MLKRQLGLPGVYSLRRVAGEHFRSLDLISSSSPQELGYLTIAGRVRLLKKLGDEVAVLF